MTKIVAMIPARMGSKRIPKKNIRLLNGIPLISYIIRAVKEAGCFDEIYVNSESDLIGKIAKDEGVNFYKRSEDLTKDTSTNDEFTFDFMNKINCDVLIQVLATSPFTKPEEIKDFTKTMIKKNLDTLISVNNQQIECVYENSPINFNKRKPSPPSQSLNPIQSYACSLMGWKTSTFKKNMHFLGSGYHGGDGTVGFFELKGESTIDIDNEEDFQFAEMVARFLSSNNTYDKKFYDDDLHVEVDVPEILKKDGVFINDLHSANSEVPISVNTIRESFDDTTSWSKRIIDTENNSATLIHQQPGEGNRLHYHPDWNEWWYIIDGNWEWDIEGKKVVVKKDDVVFIPKGKVHKITAVGDKPAIRLAVSRADVEHVYPKNET
jgi:CMP-N-acetylneuraminic acid synthetase/quercetin dioxygenase-like cupin family protein